MKTGTINLHDKSIEILHRAVRDSKIERTEKIKAIKRLSVFYNAK